MERSQAVLLALMGVSGVWFSRISGSEVEMRVRPGDDITLYSDCVLKTGFKTAWFRKSSHDRPPTVLTKDTVQMDYPRYSFVWNSSSNADDLLMKKVCKSDLGLYYCTTQRKKLSKGGDKSHVYNKGNRTIRLSLLDSTVPFADLPKTTSTPPVSDCSICWKLLVTVCPLCVLLVSICVYCIYRYRTKAADGGAEQRGNIERTGERNEVEEEVCYASLDLPSRGQKHLEKKKRVKSSDFITYSEIKTDRV